MVLQPPAADVESRSSAGSGRYLWLTAERQAHLRAVLFGITLFFGLVVWVWHSFGAAAPHPGAFIAKLRIVGIMTWLYALVQIVDMRFWNSTIARKRRAAMGIPESLIAWLFGQMLAWFGIIYYGFTEDVRWYAAGLAVLLLTFAVFPVRRGD
ncbi:MAG: hypothetical protein JWM95_2521 [Gemmatimonadetes bacterium]|nr:hypothetical protein [Gemmatimonadota bacterium]